MAMYAVQRFEILLRFCLHIFDLNKTENNLDLNAVPKKGETKHFTEHLKQLWAREHPKVMNQ